MQNPASFKLGAAFLAGVALALGGAFFYVRVSDPDPHPAMQVAPVVDTSPPAEQKLPDSTVPPTPSPASATLPVTTTRVVVRTRRPVSLAIARPAVQIKPLRVTEQQPAFEPPSSPPPDSVSNAGTEQPVAGPMVAPIRQPHTVTIPAGTSLSVRLSEKLSTEHNFSGDTFRAALDSPIVMDGFIIADRGAKVLGRVVNVRKPGKMEGMAELSLVLTEVATTDGQHLPLETNESLRKGPSNTNEEVVKMAGGAALGAIIGAIAGGGRGAAIGAGAGGAAGTGAVLLGRGKPAVIENETRLNFELASAATITEHLN